MSEASRELNHCSMREFSRLYTRLDGAKSLQDKILALALYLGTAPPEDAAWAAALLLNAVPARIATPRDLRAWAAQATQLPAWLIERSYAASGDLSETMALLVEKAVAPERLGVAEAQSWPQPPTDASLAWWIDTFLSALRELSGLEKQLAVAAAWSVLELSERVVLNKLLTGSLRVRGGRQLLERALADTAQLPRSVISQRIDAALPLTSESFRLVTSSAQANGTLGERDCTGLPYPFRQIPSGTINALGDVEAARWQAEFRLSGSVRVQVVKHNGCVAVWSSEHDNYTRQLPEIVALGETLPDGTIIEGYVVPWNRRDERPSSAIHLIRRLEKRDAPPRGNGDDGLLFLAADCLQLRGRDLRAMTYSARRELLSELPQSRTESPEIRLAPVLPLKSWDELRRHLDDCRDFGADGIVLRRLDAPCDDCESLAGLLFVPAEAHAVNAVLLYAEAARGQAVSRFTNYTFGVWASPGGERALIPIAKTPDGLTDGERRQIDRYVQQHTLERHGPVRVVQPSLVCRLEFDAVEESTRHKSGLTLRAPRAARLLPNTEAESAGTLDEVLGFMNRIGEGARLRESDG